MKRINIKDIRVGDCLLLYGSTMLILKIDRQSSCGNSTNDGVMMSYWYTPAVNGDDGRLLQSYYLASSAWGTSDDDDIYHLKKR